MHTLNGVNSGIRLPVNSGASWRWTIWADITTHVSQSQAQAYANSRGSARKDVGSILGEKWWMVKEVVYPWEAAGRKVGRGNNGPGNGKRKNHLCKGGSLKKYHLYNYIILEHDWQKWKSSLRRFSVANPSHTRTRNWDKKKNKAGASALLKKKGDNMD